MNQRHEINILNYFKFNYVMKSCIYRKEDILQDFCKKSTGNMVRITFLLVHRRNLMSLYFLLILSGSLVYTHVIKTKLGLLEGVTKEARNKKLFHAYYGIPYAKAPTGKLRFEPPVEAGAWSGIFNATEEPSSPCSQIDSSDGTYKGQENCLFVHIYTPTNVNPGSNVPVIFYIFGGVFRYGNPLREGPEFIMSRDVIIVMVSYRLGVLGLLSTGDTVIPGNMALKDQTLAMKWTKDNIYEFGGDPDRITLQGHSSGAACVHLHTLSPLSEKYFHRVIIMSGLGINPQSFRDRDSARGIARALAARVNCSADTSEKLKECLQGKTDKELVLATEKLRIWNMEPQAVFRPVIEDKNVENAFLTQNPLDAPYVSEEKPWLIGMTSDEAASYVGTYFHPDSSIINMDPKLLFPIIGCFGWTSKPNHVNFIAHTLKTYFFGEEDVCNTTDIADIAIVKMLNGIMHGYGLLEVLQKFNGLKYAYLFDYRYVGGYTNSKGGRGGRFLGVGHADELAIIFLEPNKTGIAEEDLMFGDEMITRWINFVYSGNPNIPFPINVNVFGGWSPISSPSIEFLRIRNGGGMEKDYFPKEYGFWRKIPFFSKYR